MAKSCRSSRNTWPNTVAREPGKWRGAGPSVVNWNRRVGSVAVANFAIKRDAEVTVRFPSSWELLGAE